VLNKKARAGDHEVHLVNEDGGQFASITAAVFARRCRRRSPARGLAVEGMTGQNKWTTCPHELS